MCKNISLDTTFLKTRAQRFPEPEVISLYLISLGIFFTVFSLTFWTLIYWFVEIQPVHGFTCYSSKEQWKHQSAAFMSHSRCCAQPSAEEWKSHTFHFCQNPRMGPWVLDRLLKTQVCRLPKYFPLLTCFCGLPICRGSCLAGTLLFLINQLRGIIIQCCVMVAYWEESSQGRECWQLYPELATLDFLSCAKATRTDLCRNPMKIGQGKIWTKLLLLTSSLTRTSHLTFSMQRSDD